HDEFVLANRGQQALTFDFHRALRVGSVTVTGFDFDEGDADRGAKPLQVFVDGLADPAGHARADRDDADPQDGLRRGARLRGAGFGVVMPPTGAAFATAELSISHMRSRL